MPQNMKKYYICTYQKCINIIMKIHISLLGKEPLPCYYAIREYKADRIYLLGTSDNKEIAEAICRFLFKKGKKVSFESVIPYDPSDIIQACEKIHQAFPQAECLYNLTGGTKVMSFAAYAIAMKHKADAIYISQENKMVSMRTFETRPFDCSLGIEEIFELHGQQLSRQEEVTSDKEQAVECSLIIKNFIINHPKLYRKLQQKNFVNSSSLCLKKIKGGGCIIESEGTPLFCIDHPNSSLLLFKGRWWEILVADAITRWKKKQNYTFSVYKNVVFKPRSLKGQKITSEPKNEIDLLINIGNKLIFVECKSGTVTQEDIYKLNSVRHTYGGGMSRAVLISFYPLNDILKEKANENHIRIYARNHIAEQCDFLNRLSDFLESILSVRNI